jgi:hypothetical protein
MLWVAAAEQRIRAKRRKLQKVPMSKRLRRLLLPNLLQLLLLLQLALSKTKPKSSKGIQYTPGFVHAIKYNKLVPKAELLLV